MLLFIITSFQPHFQGGAIDIGKLPIPMLMDAAFLPTDGSLVAFNCKFQGNTATVRVP
jgi:hypothetical protein